MMELLCVLQALMEMLLPEVIASLYSPYLVSDPTGAPQPILQVSPLPLVLILHGMALQCKPLT